MSTSAGRKVVEPEAAVSWRYGAAAKMLNLALCRPSESRADYPKVASKEILTENGCGDPAADVASEETAKIGAQTPVFASHPSPRVGFGGGTAIVVD